MADKMPSESKAPFATRVDFKTEELSLVQLDFIKKAETEQMRKKLPKLLFRNSMTGLAIGAAVLGLYGFTCYRMSQQSKVDEKAEAK